MTFIHLFNCLHSALVTVYFLQLHFIFLAKQSKLYKVRGPPYPGMTRLTVMGNPSTTVDVAKPVKISHNNFVTFDQCTGYKGCSFTSRLVIYFT